MDPYWGGMWNLGQSANWFTRRAMERLVEQGRMTAPKLLETSVGDAAMDAAYGYRSKDSLAAIAAMGCFRTLSVEQLAAIVGQPLLANPNSKLTPNLIATGIISEGIVQVPGKHTVPKMLRAVATADTAPLFDLLSWDDLVGVTHGQPWRSGAIHDRHNMLAAELLLRLAEYTGVALCLGEQLAQMQQLTGVASNRAGDGMFVRPDGSIVVLEMTATVSSNFPAKVDKWAAALGQNPGLSVLFVDISYPDAAERSRNISKVIRKEVHRVVSDMSAVLAGTNQRMMVGRWADWFPGTHQVHPSFFSLTAQRPTGSGDKTWQSVEILDPFDFSLPPKGKPLLENSNLLYGIPHWQRTGTARLPRGEVLSASDGN